MIRRILPSILIALTVLLFAAVPAYAAYGTIYTDSSFANEVKNSSVDAEWGIIEYKEPSDGKATIKLALQTKVDLGNEQPVLLEFWLLSTETIDVKGSAYIQAVDPSTYLPANENLMTLNFTVPYDTDVPAGSTDYWLAGNTITKDMHGYCIIAMSLTDDMSKVAQGRWVITLEISGIKDADNFDVNLGIPYINAKIPGSYALTGVNNTTTGYLVGSRWLYLPTSEVVENYIVSFSANGGSAVNPITVEKGKSTVLPTSSKDGSTFDGWYSDAALKDKAASPHTPTSDITLYAGWKEEAPIEEKWTITFDSKGGSAVNAISVTKGQSASLPNPTLSGYSFSGWYSDSNLLNKVTSPYTPASDVTLYAGWTVNTTAAEKWTITFNTNGGSSVSALSVTKGESVTLPTPTKSDASFVGWYTDNTMQNKVSSPYTPTSDVTLYACWLQNSPSVYSKWTIYFNSNGGSSVSNISVNKGESAVLPTPSKTGYTFTGWYTESGLTDKASSPYTPAKDITLYAGWEQNAQSTAAKWTITFNSNGGSSISNISVNKGESVSLPAPSLNGYTFAGWYTESAMRNKVSSPYTPYKDITLYANWTAASTGGDSNVNDNTGSNAGSGNAGNNTGNNTGNNGSVAQITYTVSYNTNGGGDISSSVVNAGNAVTLPTPAKSGYTFAGWYIDSSLDTKIATSTYIPTADTTMYAKWTANVSNNGSADNNVPKTGVDNSSAMIFVILAILIACAVVIVFVRYRRISKDK